MVVGVGLWVYLLAIRKDVVAESIAARRGWSRWVSFAVVAIGFGLLAVLVRWLSVDESLRRRIAGRIRSETGRSRPAARWQHPGGYEPQFATGPVLVVLALLAVAAVAWYLSHRARRRRLEPHAGHAASRADGRPGGDARRSPGRGGSRGAP